MPLNYQDMIGALQAYWAERECVVMQPYHTELGAGTFNPATFLRCLGPDPWRTVYVEPCLRPSDGRYGENPYRFQQYYQLQVILKPAPEDILDQYFGSLEAIGIDTRKHDVRLVEDDWEGPTLGAWGLGWEVWCDGMEITQFTYFQQLGGMDVEVVSGEITYGLERLAMFLQGKKTAFELEWAPGFTWGEVYRENERQFSAFNFDEASVEVLMRHFADYEDGVPPAPRAQPAAAGVRPGAQGFPHVQPARRPRRDLGHRAGFLHRAGPRSGRRSASSSLRSDVADAAV